jgi:catechol 2,3-dioxygenase-like lactoylglutathione lyase family enzyme
MVIKIISIDHVQVCIPPGKESEARNFYSGVLELEEIEKPESLKPSGGLWYRIGNNQELHIGIEQSGQETKAHPAFEVLHLDEARNYLERNGIEINEETRIPGVSRFSIRDPFGNRLEFLERL